MRCHIKMRETNKTSSWWEAKKLEAVALRKPNRFGRFQSKCQRIKTQTISLTSIRFCRAIRWAARARGLLQQRERGRSQARRCLRLQVEGFCNLKEAAWCAAQEARATKSCQQLWSISKWLVFHTILPKSNLTKKYSIETSLWRPRAIFSTWLCSSWSTLTSTQLIEPC